LQGQDDLHLGGFGRRCRGVGCYSVEIYRISYSEQTAGGEYGVRLVAWLAFSEILALLSLDNAMPRRGSRKIRRFL
jgi:hypothetical protein